MITDGDSMRRNRCSRARSLKIGSNTSRFATSSPCGALMFSIPFVDTKWSRSASLTAKNGDRSACTSDNRSAGLSMARRTAASACTSSRAKYSLPPTSAVAHLARSQPVFERRDELRRHLPDEDGHVTRPRGPRSLDVRVVDGPRLLPRDVVDERRDRLGDGCALADPSACPRASAQAAR